MALTMFLSGAAAEALANPAAATAATPTAASTTTSPTPAAVNPAPAINPSAVNPAAATMNPTPAVNPVPVAPLSMPASVAAVAEDFSNVDDLIGETYGALIEKSGLLRCGMFFMLARCEFVRFEIGKIPFCIASIAVGLPETQMTDSALKKIGECFESNCQPLDILAYAGKSRLYAMFPQSNEATVRGALAKFMIAFSSSVLDNNLHGANVKVAIGLAEVPRDGVDFLQVFQHADKYGARLLSKHTVQNFVCAAVFALAMQSPSLSSERPNLLDQLDRAERIVFNQSHSEQGLEARVSVLEIKLFGARENGAIVPRINRINTALKLDTQTTGNSAPTSQILPGHPDTLASPASQATGNPDAKTSAAPLQSTVSASAFIELPPNNSGTVDRASQTQMLEKAAALMQQGETETARQILESLTGADFRNDRAHFMLGNIAFKKGDFAEALKDFSFAHFAHSSDSQYQIASKECEQLVNQKLNPHYHDYHLYPDKGDVRFLVNRGVRFWALGKGQQAKEFFEQALRYHRNADALYNLGAIAECEGNLPRALGFYQQAQYAAATQINNMAVGRTVSTLFGGIVHTSNSGISLEELQASFADSNRAIQELQARIQKGDKGDSLRN